MQQPLVTYAQNREDLYLWALVGHRQAGIYVDVGCYDELSHSVTRLFYEHGWSGLNIDANPTFGPGYSLRTRDRFVHSAVGSEPGTCTFRIYPYHDGLSTMDPGVMSMHESSALPYQDITVDVRTLDEILAEQAITRVDFLKVDVEGAEASVLRGLDLTAIRPAVIVLEGVHLVECDALLRGHGYRREFFDGLNAYFVDDDAADVSILNFAGQVLHAGYWTARERQLLAEVDVLRSTAGYQAPTAASRSRTPRQLASLLRTRGWRGLLATARRRVRELPAASKSRLSR